LLIAGAGAELLWLFSRGRHADSGMMWYPTVVRCSKWRKLWLSFLLALIEYYSDGNPSFKSNGRYGLLGVPYSRTIWFQQKIGISVRPKSLLIPCKNIEFGSSYLEELILNVNHGIANAGLLDYAGLSYGTPEADSFFDRIFRLYDKYRKLIGAPI